MAETFTLADDHVMKFHCNPAKQQFKEFTPQSCSGTCPTKQPFGYICIATLNAIYGCITKPHTCIPIPMKFTLLLCSQKKQQPPTILNISILIANYCKKIKQ